MIDTRFGRDTASRDGRAPLCHGRCMPDDLTPEQIEQLARSLAMSSTMTDTDRLAVVELLRQLVQNLHHGSEGLAGVKSARSHFHCDLARVFRMTRSLLVGINRALSKQGECTSLPMCNSIHVRRSASEGQY